MSKCTVVRTLALLAMNVWYRRSTSSLTLNQFGDGDLVRRQ